MSNTLNSSFIKLIENSESCIIRAGGYEYTGPATVAGVGRTITITDEDDTVWVIDAADVTAVHGVPPED